MSTPDQAVYAIPVGAGFDPAHPVDGVVVEPALMLGTPIILSSPGLQTSEARPSSVPQKGMTTEYAKYVLHFVFHFGQRLVKPEPVIAYFNSLATMNPLDVKEGLVASVVGAFYLGLVGIILEGGGIALIFVKTLLSLCVSFGIYFSFIHNTDQEIAMAGVATSGILLAWFLFRGFSQLGAFSLITGLFVLLKAALGLLVLYNGYGVYKVAWAGQRSMV
jgi:hypothetical protein